MNTNKNELGGHLAMSQATVANTAEKYGIEAASELVLFQQNQVYTMKVAVDKEKLDCDAVLTRYMEAYLSQSHADEAKQVYEKQLAAGYDFTRDVTFIKPDFVEEVSDRSSIVCLLSRADLYRSQVSEMPNSDSPQQRFSYGPISLLLHFWLDSWKGLQ